MAQHDEFMIAVKQGDGPTVAELLRRHPELIAAADEYDKTGLHWAAEKDHLEIARLLLDAGADIEAKTNWGDTPLNWAATLGSANVAELLLGRGARGFTLNWLCPKSTLFVCKLSVSLCLCGCFSKHY